MIQTRKRLDGYFVALFVAIGIFLLFIFLRNATAIASRFYESMIASKAYVSIGKGLLVTMELTLMGGATAFGVGVLLCTLRISGIRCVERVFSIASVFFAACLWYRC